MNSMNHILIGSIVYDYLQEKYGIMLQKSGFLKGNTCPDHGISFLRPHKVKYCGRLVRRKTEKLFAGSRPINRRTSKKIGILCHYYSDFFCFAHSPGFSGSLKEHVRHENCLLYFMSENYETFREIDYISEDAKPESAGEITSKMNLLLMEGSAAEDDYEEELFRAVRACSELVLSICLSLMFVRTGKEAK